VSVSRRRFLRDAGAAAILSAGAAWPPLVAQAGAAAVPRLVDVTAAAGINFRHRSGAYGGKLLPETMGAGCAFVDYDADGWPDILLVNGMDWPGHRRERSTLRLYHNNRNGTFTDVTRRAGLDVELYGMGVAVGDFNNDGYPDLFLTCVGQSRLFRNTGKGTFVDVTRTSGLGGRTGFSTSALWFDFDRDGFLDLFVCNYVKWSPERDVVCSADGRRKSYCTPEAYRGDTCWLFRNRGNGTFEDATATSGIFDSSSKSLGVTMIDDGGDGWMDLVVANDTQPNKLYRNQRNGTFREVGLAAGVALSRDGHARAGMGIDSGDFENSGRAGLAITNFDNEMMGLYRAPGPGLFEDVATAAGIGHPSRTRLGFGCVFADMNLDGSLDLVVANGHIDEPVRGAQSGMGQAQPPFLFANQGNGLFRDATAQAGPDFARPKVARGLAYGDFDRDGDVDLLMTTNNGPAVLYRSDQTSGNRGIRLTLVGTQSNRDAIGARVQVLAGGTQQTRLVKSGSSYLSQSELSLTIGLGRRDRADRVVIHWPSGRTEEFTNLATGRAYTAVEGKGLA
jgi:hypothetical protein